MLSALSYWFKSIIGDIVAFGLLYLWQIKGMPGAGNAFAFLVWALIVVRLLIGFLGDRESFKKCPQRPPGFKTYHACTEILLILSLAWIGMLWAAVLSVLAVVLYEAARTKDPKPNTGAEA